MARDYDPKRSSVSVGEDKGKRGLLPIILGLLALIILLVVIGLVSCGGDDDDGGDDAAAPTTSAPTTASTPSAPTAGTGTLTSASQSLLGGDASSIGQQTGQQAEGTGVEVLSVAKDGFFVGTGDADRQYVEFGGEVGEDETGAGDYKAKVGDTVDLTGEVRPAPQDPGRTLRLEQADSDLVSQRGAFINADSVTPSAG